MFRTEKVCLRDEGAGTGEGNCLTSCGFGRACARLTVLAGDGRLRSAKPMTTRGGNGDAQRNAPGYWMDHCSFPARGQDH